jgi:hypothetical protein
VEVGKATAEEHEDLSTRGGATARNRILFVLLGCSLSLSLSLECSLSLSFSCSPSLSCSCSCSLVYCTRTGSAMI